MSPTAMLCVHITDTRLHQGGSRNWNFWGLTAAILKMTVFWDTAPCRLVHGATTKMTVIEILVAIAVRT
jgi:hypothetical protein